MPDSELLYDVNLQTLLLEQLLAEWRVTARRTNAGSEQNWAEATHVNLDAGTLCVQNGSQQTCEGTWSMQRSDRLSQPFLELQLPQGPAQALVTRLRSTSNGQHRRLNLYFQSGLELELTHP